MNYRLILRQLGLLVLVLSGLLLLIWGWSVIQFELIEHRPHATHLPILLSAAFGVVIAVIFLIVGKKPSNEQGTGLMGRREALLLVSMSWFVGAIVSAAPFLFWARMAGE